MLGNYAEDGCQQISMVYIDFSFANFDNSTYDRNITIHITE